MNKKVESEIKEEKKPQMATKQELAKLRAEGLKRLQNPTIKAVFERLKDK